MPKGERFRREYREEFRKDPKAQEWFKSLHPNTRPSYDFELSRLCRQLNLTASGLLKAVEENPKELSKQIKTVLKIMERKHSGTSAGKARSILTSFLAFNEMELRLVGLKLKASKPKAHPLLTWEDMERIVSLADPAYQPAFKLMSWGLDAERVIQINNDPATLQDVKQQLQDPNKDFIKVSIPRRKGNPDPFYVLLPRQIAAYLPIRTVRNEPLRNKTNLWHQWRQAIRRAGLPVDFAHGAHNLRSCWLTEATKRNLPPVLREFQLGHEVDTLNYQRLAQDEAYVLGEFRKAWQIKPIATLDQLQERNGKIAELEQKVQSLEAAQKLLNRLDEIVTPELIQKWKDEGKKVVISNKEYERRRKAGESNVDIFGAKTGKHRKSKV